MRVCQRGSLAYLRLRRLYVHVHLQVVHAHTVLVHHPCHAADERAPVCAAGLAPTRAASVEVRGGVYLFSVLRVGQGGDEDDAGWCRVAVS